MVMNLFYPEYEVIRNKDKCTNCKICIKECANEVHSFNEKFNTMTEDSSKCVNCHRCVATCPMKALKIVKTDHVFKENENWSKQTIEEIYKQATSGGVLLSSWVIRRNILFTGIKF